ncbi:MAG: hypothetical protein K5910_02550 [Bacteroidales bacterium]|nr:hypothetical protein [Bacteroidales bacterium]
MLAALVAAACTKEAPVSENVIRFRADAPVPAQTKMTQESDEATTSGLVFKWEEDDVICLNFNYDGNYYTADAEIDASSISASGTSADFTVTVPEEIPSDASFDVYAAYQDEYTWGTRVNRCWNGTGEDPAVFFFDADANQGTTLDDPGTCQAGILRPALYAELKDVTAETLDSFSLSHLGWVMCVHLKNTGSEAYGTPRRLMFKDPQGDYLFAGSKYSCLEGPVLDRDYIYSYLAEYSWSPWSGSVVPAGEEQLYYRWVCSTESIPNLTFTYIVLNEDNTTSIVSGGTLPAKTVTPGKVYHVYMEGSAYNNILIKE